MAEVGLLLTRRRCRPDSGHRPGEPIRGASGVRGVAPRGDGRCGGGGESAQPRS